MKKETKKDKTRVALVQSCVWGIFVPPIFDKNFKLLDGPIRCISDVCPCNEWAFLLEEKYG